MRSKSIIGVGTLLLAMVGSRAAASPSQPEGNTASAAATPPGDVAALSELGASAKARALAAQTAGTRHRERVTLLVEKRKQLRASLATARSEVAKDEQTANTAYQRFRTNQKSKGAAAPLEPLETARSGYQATLAKLPTVLERLQALLAVDDELVQTTTAAAASAADAKSAAQDARNGATRLQALADEARKTADKASDDKKADAKKAADTARLAATTAKTLADEARQAATATENEAAKARAQAGIGSAEVTAAKRIQADKDIGSVKERLGSTQRSLNEVNAAFEAARNAGSSSAPPGGKADVGVIAAAIGLKRVGNQLFADVCDDPVELEVRVLHLGGAIGNAQLAHASGTCYGKTGSRIVILASDKGALRPILDVNAGNVQVRKTNSQGVFDIELEGGTGIAIWRWNGSKYAFWKNE